MTSASHSMVLASRGVGELAAVERLPGAVVALFELITHLGDPLVLLLGLSLCYVAAEALGLERPSAGFVLAVAFGALALTLALKTAFALPRPPGAGEDGFGFPSGHALGSTVVWGALALAFPWGTRRNRLLACGAIAALVAVSRVVIGVHYLVDVAVGAAVGVAFLYACVRIGGLGLGALPASSVDVSGVRRVLALAIALSFCALFVDVSGESAIAVGASVGGLVGWELASGRGPGVRLPSPAASGERRSVVAGLVVLPVFLSGIVVVREATLALPVVVVVTALLVAGVFVLPQLTRMALDRTAA